MKRSHTLEDYLDQSSGAAAVLAHARLLQKLERDYQASVPDYLAESSHIANLKGGVLVIHAVSGALAVKLRQIAPSLAEALARKGYECREIQVKVHTALPEVMAHNATVKPLPDGGRERLSELAEALPAGSLRAAITRLLERSR